MNRPLIVIPARINSGRLKQKAMLDDTGQPLICHTVETAGAAAAVVQADIVVCTDSGQIAGLMRRYPGVRVSYDASPDLWCGTVRAARYVAAHYRSFKDRPCIINWQLDEPLVTPAMIAKLVDRFHSDVDSIATLVAPLDDKANSDVNAVKVHVQGGECVDFIRTFNDLANRQHVGVYGFRPSTLVEVSMHDQSERSKSRSLEQLTWLDYGYNIGAVEIDYAPISINVRSDYLQFVQQIQSG